VVHHAVIGHLFVFGARLSIVAIGVDAKAATRQEFTPYFDVSGLHQAYEVFHHDVDAIFMKRAMITETE